MKWKQPVLKRLIVISYLCAAFLCEANAQFFNGVGVMGGVTAAKHKWYFNDVDVVEKKNFILRYNACVFMEFFSYDYFRWRTEFQYNQKGSIDKDTVKFKNKQDYLCWNNFLVFRRELYIGIPYILIGPRVEYRFKQAPQSPEITGNFNTLQLSPSIGAGWEFIVFSSFKPIVELHYNPDIKLNAYKVDPLEIKNRAWELRAGLKYVFSNKSTESCPPVYK